MYNPGDFQKMMFGMMCGLTVAVVAKVAYSIGKAAGEAHSPYKTDTTYYVPWTEEAQ